MDALRIDFGNLMADRVEGGIEPDHFEGELARSFEAAHTFLESKGGDGELGFIDLPYATESVEQVSELADGFVVYDPQEKSVHVLSESTLFVWRRCEGRHTAAEIVAEAGAKVLRHELGVEDPRALAGEFGPPRALFFRAPRGAAAAAGETPDPHGKTVFPTSFANGTVQCSN